MGTVLLSNNARTTLATGCASGDTSLTVASSTTFPAPTTASGNWFYACLQDTFANLEIVKVTNVSGAVWTVTRAIGGTTALAFPSGTVVELRITAETLNDVTNYNVTTNAQNSTPMWITAVAGTNTITGTLPAPFTAYAAGQTFQFIAAAANTGAVTININSAGAKAVTKQGGIAFSGGEFAAGTTYILIYDGTEFQLTGAATGANGDINSLNALTSINGGQLAGLRNRLINGSMSVDQRNNGSVATQPTSFAYNTVDRWSIYPTGAAVTAARNLSSGAYRLAISGATSNTGFTLFQRIESINIADLSNANTIVTLSAVLSCDGGTFPTVQAQYAIPGATDNYGTSTTTNIGSPVTLTTTPTRYYWTFSVSPFAVAGMAVNLTFSALIASNIIYVANVQLEPGLVGTVFEQRPYGQELLLCQRYYQNVGSNFSGSTIANTYEINVPFWIPVRATPGVSVRSGCIISARSNTGGSVGDWNTTSPTIANVTASTYGIWLQVATSGLGGGWIVAGRHQNGDLDNFLAISAEL